MQVLELKSPKNADEIEAEAGENTGHVDLTLAPTRKGWELLEAASVGDSVVIISADGASFIGDIDDIDEDAYVLWVALR